MSYWKLDSKLVPDVSNLYAGDLAVACFSMADKPVISQSSDVACTVRLTERNTNVTILDQKVYTFEANARLIAAAPALLAVLLELQESAGYWSEYDVPAGIVDRINAVIAKAKGSAV